MIPIMADEGGGFGRMRLDPGLVGVIIASGHEIANDAGYAVMAK